MAGEAGAFARLTFGGDKTMMEIHDLSANGKPNAGASVFVFRMQPVKHTEYFLRFILGKTNAVIGDNDPVKHARNGSGFRLFVSNIQQGRLPRNGKLDGIINQMMKKQ